MPPPPEQTAARTIRALAMDAVQRAGSGHPGMPMGMADLAVVLWTRHLLADPAAPQWPDRDRFVLSNGHGSMLLYAVLHLCGYPVTMDDLRNFRQWGSPTAGHPEYEPQLGMETTTGPLGQGFGTAVGMAVAEAHLNGVFGDDLVNHRTWAFVSDGDLMEGVSYETASLAGHLGLGKLNFVYDDNRISIDGSTDLAFTEQVDERFAAAGWHTARVDGHDHAAIDQALREAAEEAERPSLVIARTRIAYGAPTKQDTAASHGSPLGEEEIAGWREAVGWPDEDFHVPDGVRGHMERGMERGRAARAAWEERFRAAMEDPDAARLWESYFQPPPVSVSRPDSPEGEMTATRSALGKLLAETAGRLPGLVGGAADLAASTKTVIPGGGSFSRRERRGRNIHFGIREHGMGAVVNGINLHGGLRAFGSTFLVFSDYMRPAVRLSALMDIPSLWLFTHDSVFLGEDGPTHQPIEHLASLRAMPNLRVFRPADAGEAAETWEVALNQSHPAVFLGARQNTPALPRPQGGGGAARGGYALAETGSGPPRAVVIATGSETAPALEAARMLAGEFPLRVVSMPCAELFLEQPYEYQRETLGEGLPAAVVEAGASFGWERFAGPDGLIIGVDRFGASAPAQRIAEELGLTAPAIAVRLRTWLGARSP